MVVKHTWEDLAEKSHFLLKVSVGELLMDGLHKVLTRVEEVLRDGVKHQQHQNIKHQTSQP